MSDAVSSVRARLAILVGALGFAVLPLFAQSVGEPSECFTECHDMAMEIEDEQDGPMWPVADFVFKKCLEGC